VEKDFETRRRYNTLIREIGRAQRTALHHVVTRCIPLQSRCIPLQHVATRHRPLIDRFREIDRFGRSALSAAR
jgi:hypothetical protein